MSYEQRGDTLEVRIVSRRNGLLLIFLAIWLIGWGGAGLAIVAGFFRGETDPWVGLWLVFWAAAGCLAAYIWLWNALGKEIIRITPEVLSVGRVVPGLRFARRSFPVAQITNLRASGLFGNLLMSYNWAMWGLSGGMIAFEYRGKTYRFGIHLEEHEARSLVDRLRGHLPPRVFGDRSSV